MATEDAILITITRDEYFATRRKVHELRLLLERINVNGLAPPRSNTLRRDLERALVGEVDRG